MFGRLRSPKDSAVVEAIAWFEWTGSGARLCPQAISIRATSDLCRGFFERILWYGGAQLELATS